MAKIQENVQCEIMKVIAEEARQSYKEGVVVRVFNSFMIWYRNFTIGLCSEFNTKYEYQSVYLKSDTTDDMDENFTNIIDWINQQ